MSTSHGSETRRSKSNSWPCDCETFPRGNVTGALIIMVAFLKRNKPTFYVLKQCRLLPITFVIIVRFSEYLWTIGFKEVSRRWKLIHRHVNRRLTGGEKTKLRNMLLYFWSSKRLTEMRTPPLLLSEGFLGCVQFSVCYCILLCFQTVAVIHCLPYRLSWGYYHICFFLLL